MEKVTFIAVILSQAQIVHPGNSWWLLPFLPQSKWKLFSLLLRWSLRELYSREPQGMISSSASDLFGAQEPVLPCCDCQKAQRFPDHSFSFGSSGNNSRLSHLPVSSEGTSWQLQSQNSILPQKQPPGFRSQGTSLPSSQNSELGKSKLLQALEALSPSRPQCTFIKTAFESPNLCKQQKSKGERRSKGHLTSDHGQSSISKDRPQFPRWALNRLSPFARRELEEHMTWKVYTLQKQTVPLRVRKSWAMVYDLTEV